MPINTYYEPLSVTHYDDSKFKSVVFSLRFFIPLRKGDNTKLALLSELMNDRNEKYPTKQAMLAIQDFLYGADLKVRTAGFGTFQSLEVRVETINETYLNEPIQKLQVEYLTDVAYTPLINEETLKEAKISLRDKLNRQNEKPSRFALKEAFRIAGEGTTLAISTNGEVEDIESITVNDMTEFHRQLVNDSMAELFVVGHLPQCKDLIQPYFRSHRPLDTSGFSYLLDRRNVQAVTKQLPIGQATLVKVYSTQVNVESSDYYAYQVGNVVLGQLPTSLLFQEVREKHSLCYSIGSSTVGFDGVLYMVTQLANENIDLASQLMDQQLVRIQHGEIDDKVIEGAKLMLQNSLYSITDSEVAILNFMVNQKVMGRTTSLEELIALYQGVSKSDIIKAFTNVDLILNYQLEGTQQ